MKGCIWSIIEATCTCTCTYHNTNFPSKFNCCGMLSSFWRDEGCFKALCKRFSGSFEGFHSLVHGPSMWRSNACSAKILLMIPLRSLWSSAMGSQRVRILRSKGYRAYKMLETLNSLQREPQQTDLNMRHKLISRLPRPVFICCVSICMFTSRQSALIAWHNAFNKGLYT